MRNRFVLSTRGGIVLGTLFIYAWTPGPSTPATVWQKCLNYCKIGVAATVVMDVCVLCVCVLGVNIIKVGYLSISSEAMEGG